VRHAEHSVYH